MKKLIVGLLALGLTTQFMFSQEIELAEVRLDVNYQYLDAIDSEDLDLEVKYLEKEAAFYGSELPSDYDLYPVTFVIPKGKIVAFYDNDGRINRTIERFKNIELPRSVIESVAARYPNWRFVGDSYRVDYYGKSGLAKKQYKVKLEKEGKKMTVKINEVGELL